MPRTVNERFVLFRILSWTSNGSSSQIASGPNGVFNRLP
jgi:hypothetical protein